MSAPTRADRSQVVTETAVIQACQRLASHLGLGRVQPVVIGRHSNLALWLDPGPWVARVATGTAGPRAQAAWARREVTLARALSRAGAAVATPAPGDLAGPHVQDGWRLTLWQRLALHDTAPDPCAAGRALARCHAVLHDLPHDGLGEPTPPWSPLDETARLLAHPVIQARAGDDAGWVARRLAVLDRRVRHHRAPVQWLHGDAHLNNVRRLADGSPVWLDWEDACRAPLEWDLAGLVGAARVLGSDVDWAEAALGAWREVGRPVDEDLLDDCIELRALFVVAWTWWLGPDLAGRRERLAARLAWLRQRPGG